MSGPYPMEPTPQVPITPSGGWAPEGDPPPAGEFDARHLREDSAKGRLDQTRYTDAQRRFAASLPDVRDLPAKENPVHDMHDMYKTDPTDPTGAIRR